MGRVARPTPQNSLALVSGALCLLLAVSCESPLLQKVLSVREKAESPTLVVSTAAGKTLANGDTYDFGLVGVSATSDAVLTISNTGKSELKIPSTGLVLSGTAAGCYSVSVTPPATLAPGASATFTVRFSPGTGGTKAAVLTLSTNDVADGAFRLALTGSTQVPTPVVVGGNSQCFLTGSPTVEIQCADTGAKIYYTTNGTKPAVANVGNGTLLYSGQFLLPFDTSAVVKVLAVHDGYGDSDVVIAKFSRTEIVAPTVTPSITASAYTPENLPLSFTISSPTTAAGAPVYILFTIGGLVPVTTGYVQASTGVTDETKTYLMANGATFVYAGPHTGGQLVINAIAYVSDAALSTVATSATYVFKLSKPTFPGVQPRMAPATYYADAQVVTLACSTGVGATITYGLATVDGAGAADAGSVGNTYSTPVAAGVGVAGSSLTTTITAVASATNWVSSDTTTGTFPVCGPGLWSSGTNNSKWDQATWQ